MNEMPRVVSSVPVGVVHGYEHASVANREDAHLVAHNLVDDAVGLDDQLAKAFGIRRDFAKADARDDGTGEREVGEAA